MSSAFAVEESSAVNLLAQLEQWFGTRDASGTQSVTVGAGMLGKQLFLVKQGGPATTDKVSGYLDARDGVKTKIKRKGERTGYHAEMMIVSAMLTHLSKDATTLTVLEAAKILKTHGPAVIVANADCCKHCAGMLRLLGIPYAGKAGKGTNTGWWNPFTDKVYANADPEFQKDVPGDG
jgi:hypothetical protein